MTIEEKAKAYDEAIKIAKETYNTQPMYRNWLESMFPELQENEIKDMREKLIKAFGSIGKKEWGGVNVKDVIHWLEKQGEQKPAEWSEEDEVKINRIVDCLENLNVADNDILLKDVDWLKSLLRNRVKPQPDMVEALRTEYEKGRADTIAEMKKDYSEEDERVRQCLIRDQEKALNDVRNDKYGYSEIISDLKEMYHERIDWLEQLKQRMGG